ncbi:hypothetical protein Tco_1093259 [Tanacetum coccineum]|uniref:Uncharacterized protein n=1 Tax=Tanacetum coccineum TaxID=301880 RepID=A0ABQ5IC67_9ASTR
MAFVSSPSSTNEVNTAYGVNTANTQVSPASTQVSTANLSDATVYAFLASQPNGSQLVYKYIEQFHEDDLEEIDLKWQLALLSMRTRRGPRNQDSRNKNQDSSRRIVNMEETSSKAMVAIDGAGFDWSYMADDEVPTNMALIAFSDSEVHNDKTCSKTCLKSFETLKTQLDDLRIKFNKSEFKLATYKRGLASVEEQLVFYKKNEVIFCEQLAVLKRDISYKDSEIRMLRSELEKLKQEKESNQLKIEKFDNASKSLDKLIGSQITDKSRKGVEFVSYNVVSPPHTGLFPPPNLDLSYSDLEEFQQPEFEGYGPKPSKSVGEDISNEVRESPIGEDYLILFFSLFELGSGQSQASRSWIWACICGSVAFSGILVSIEIKKNDQPLSLFIFTQFTFLDSLLFSFSGGDVYPCQSYDRILVTTEQLSELLTFKMRHSMRMLAKDTRSQDGIDDKDNDKGSKSRSQSMKEQAYNKEQRERPRPHELNDKSNLIDLMKECHQ